MKAAVSAQKLSRLILSHVIRSRILTDLMGLSGAFMRQKNEKIDRGKTITFRRVLFLTLVLHLG
jgi:hypothetical protein